MAQSHTWKFYLTAGRTWGGPRISGATITAFSTTTGSSVLKSLTTNANGYATYTSTGSTIKPGMYCWRVNIGNIFGDYYSGKNVIGSGTTDGYYDIPSDRYNTIGVAHVSQSFIPSDSNAAGAVVVYLFAVGNNVTIPSSKFLTHFDVLSLVPPRTNYLTSGTTRMTLNQCVTDSEMRELERHNAFYDSLLGDGSGLVVRSNIEEWSSFISGGTVSPSASTTSLYFSYNETNIKFIAVTAPSVSSGFQISLSITGSYSSYFKAALYHLEGDNDSSLHAGVRPISTNTSSNARTATLVISLYKVDSYAWFGGTIGTYRVVLTQDSYIPPGGGSGGAQT